MLVQFGGCLLLLLTTSAASIDSQDKRNCEDFANLNFHCVSYFLCNENRTIIADGADIIDVRTTGFASDDLEEDVEKIEAAYGSLCPTIQEVCCRRAGHTSPKRSTGGTVKPRAAAPAPRCGKRGKTSSESGDKSKLDDLTIPEAEFGEWPHVCMILKDQALDLDGDHEEDVTTYVAGASLIAQEVILTGLNRIWKELTDMGRLRVRCGEWDVISTDEAKPYQERRVVRVDKHPGYNPNNSYNNFAVLFVDKPFELDSHISPVCLPSPTRKFKPVAPCVSNGWGKDRFGNDGKYRTRMKEVSVALIDSEQCQETLRTTRLGQFFELHSSFVCAGGDKGVDTCKGDGGSPLVCETENGVLTQVGIAAWGISCGEDGIPGVYSNVAFASCWIDSVVTRYLSKKQNIKGSYFGFPANACVNLEK